MSLFSATTDVKNKYLNMLLHATTNEKWFKLERNYSELEPKIEINNVSSVDKKILYCCEQLFFAEKDEKKFQLSIFNEVEDALLGETKYYQVKRIFANAAYELSKKRISENVAKFLYKEYYVRNDILSDFEIVDILKPHKLIILLVTPYRYHEPPVTISAGEKGADGVFFQTELSKDEEGVFDYEEVPCIDLKTKELIDWEEKKKSIEKFKNNLSGNKLVKQVVKDMKEEQYSFVSVKENRIVFYPRYDTAGYAYEFKEWGLRDLALEEQRYLSSVILEKMNNQYYLADNSRTEKWPSQEKVCLVRVGMDDWGSDETGEW